MTLEADILAAYPAEVQIPASLVADAVAAPSPDGHRVLVVLDDDPTGTQSVADLPVLTRWDVEDFTWAFEHIAASGCKPAVYVLTNTRSLDPAEAAARNEEVVRNALAAAGSTAAATRGAASLRLGFVSRSDSTLRGHFPLEPDVIAATVAAVTGETTDGVVLVPAFPDAGRVTIGGVHYMRGTGNDAGSLTPVAETEFARDATFGFANSDMARYVEEKSQGRYPAGSVIVLDLNIIRAGAASGDPAISAKAVADALEPATNSTPIVADIVTENDLRALSLGLEEAERRGKKLLYRVGPPFGRARIGQEIRQELSGAEAYAGNTPSIAGGLIVVGSHVGVTTRQLKVLTDQHSAARIVEIDVQKLLGEGADTYLGQTVETIVDALHSGDVIVHTSRLLIKADDPAESLRIARTVSAAVVNVVNRTLKTFPPRFVIAKGGITSSDVAAHGLEIRHAIVRGPMLPGIVSLWEPVDGPAKGIPYIVFAGNVGDDESLAQVTRKLSNTF
ncbi:four-carbon acid sugar kinase family protein [Pseudarthrobacter sp. J75]|uniref:four-carbon acid sugar kinase family protein n=1 Tax=unclassified Pseudarthrobacter TaxID=2647000 RepID=UPI002E80964D|nr:MULTISPECIES: four-carbon acid sugar kinase family protein [unclassified Pseudarthrobacter]MEE2521890.1 four-carbon acid sugar kinase family protein [Pseudarthrobacter sp. J47]MEE2528815.1 four-carbon acid sugar kinase family protein [Pseudarthrobacter sp. J75]